MKPISLTVNGGKYEVLVEPRTQLAEVLRDKLHLTGTHLGCEQGVCGACTVVVDGKPVRSCIAYAGSCDGAVVETVEGFAGDPVMDDLRDAFSRHHALQCGFCTPGMIITARDIVHRLHVVDEKQIRHELSGNLCRCTGYMGIVAAIADVIAKHKGGLAVTTKSETAAPESSAAPITPFEIAPEYVIDGAGSSVHAASGISIEDGWTTIARSFTLDHALDDVWAHFEELRAVTRCLPGAEMDDIDGDRFAGNMVIKFGPINARFAGEGSRKSDVADRTGLVHGMGKDTSGQSNVRGELAYKIAQADDEQQTRIDLQTRFQIQGILAQFNRKELVESFADIIMRQFVSNCDTVLSGDELGKERNLSFITVIVQIIRSKFRQLIGRG